MIRVEQTGGPDPFEFDVSVGDGPDRTRHRVTMTEADHRRLAGDAEPARVIRAAFRFLLDRDPKEAIMASFDVTVIPRYFPDFEARLPDYLGAGGR